MANADDGPSAAQELLSLIGAGWTAQAVHVAARLGLADHLADGPLPADELARRCGAHAPSLHRLLRALTSIGVCRELSDGTFDVTATGSLLGSGPDSLRSWAVWWGTDLWHTWSHLLESVETGVGARTLTGGGDGFGALSADPGAAHTFHEALAELTRLEVQEVCPLLGLDGVERVVDVGGGSGELLVVLLREHPGLHAVLVELAHAVDAARVRLDDAGLASRCELVVGDFFRSVPPGGDAYILKNVIHDWGDDEARVVLGRCRDAMGERGRLLLVDRILPDRFGRTAADQAAARADLTMLVAQGGRERTEAELRELLGSAGLVVTTVSRGPSLGVIEARPESAG